MDIGIVIALKIYTRNGAACKINYPPQESGNKL